MHDEGDHGACVDAWLGRSARHLSSEEQLRLLEAAVQAIWDRTKVTLGEITLTAIAQRVLYNGAEKMQLLSLLRVEPAGVQFDQLRAQIGSVPGAKLREGTRFVLVEVLTVIGNLTAEILTPELHAALEKVVLSKGEDQRS